MLLRLPSHHQSRVRLRLGIWDVQLWA
jgi:hypothetical protein